MAEQVRGGPRSLARSSRSRAVSGNPGRFPPADEEDEASGRPKRQDGRRSRARGKRTGARRVLGNQLSSRPSERGGGEVFPAVGARRRGFSAGVGERARGFLPSRRRVATPRFGARDFPAAERRPAEEGRLCFGGTTRSAARPRTGLGVDGASKDRPGPSAGRRLRRDDEVDGTTRSTGRSRVRARRRADPRPVGSRDFPAEERRAAEGSGVFFGGTTRSTAGPRT